MNRDLIPVPITDKNGKRTTVHRRAQPDGRNSGAVIPPPQPSASLEQKLKERQEIRDKIFALASGGLPPTTGRKTNPLEITLLVINNTEFLEKALEIAEAIHGSNQQTFSRMGEWRRFSDDLKSKKRATIEAAYRNLDLIWESDSISTGYSRVVDLHESIADTIPTNDGSPAVVENMRSHLLTYNTLRFSGNPDIEHVTEWGVYAKEYAPIVSLYPDKVEQLCAYLMERGGARRFDKIGFEEYLSSAVPLAEGSL